MKNPRKWMLAGCAITLIAAGVRAGAADPPKSKDDPENKVAFFMRAKLANSQSVLEGLVTEDFDLVQSGAEKMIVMTKGAQWKVGAGEEYTTDTIRFVDAARDLIQNAKKKNIDGATLSYLQLTMRCVECHKHVRGIKTADRSPLPNSRDLASLRHASGRGHAH